LKIIVSDSTKETFDLIFILAEPLFNERILALGEGLSMIIKNFETLS